MSLYTRRGDEGETSLIGGARVAKDSPRVEAYGALDEAVAAVGLARVAARDDLVCGVLRFIQHKLMTCSSMLACEGEIPTEFPRVTDEDVASLERCIDGLDPRRPPSELFVVEGSCESAARLNLARTIARRAERRIVHLSADDSVDLVLMSFVNRVSDALYACSLVERSLCDLDPEPWDPNAVAPRP